MDVKGRRYMFVTTGSLRVKLVLVNRNSNSVGPVSSFVVTKSWCEQSVCFFPSRRSLVS